MNGGKRPWSLTDYLLSDVWVLLAKRNNPKKAPDAHPWRAVENKRQAEAKMVEKRRKLEARQQAARRRSPRTTGRRGPTTTRRPGTSMPREQDPTRRRG